MYQLISVQNWFQQVNASPSYPTGNSCTVLREAHHANLSRWMNELMKNGLMDGTQEVSLWSVSGQSQWQISFCYLAHVTLQNGRQRSWKTVTSELKTNKTTTQMQPSATLNVALRSFGQSCVTGSPFVTRVKSSNVRAHYRHFHASHPQHRYEQAWGGHRWGEHRATVIASPGRLDKQLPWSLQVIFTVLM